MQCAARMHPEAHDQLRRGAHALRRAVGLGRRLACGPMELSRGSFWAQRESSWSAGSLTLLTSARSKSCPDADRRMGAFIVMQKCSMLGGYRACQKMKDE